MTRAPFVMGKAASAFQRSAEVFDTTIGWRFVNPMMKKLYGVDSMPETAQNVADEFQVSRADQDAFALRSQQRAADAQAKGTFDAEIAPVEIKDRKGNVTRADEDEHPRPDTTLEALAKLAGIVRPDGSVTAGNSSGVNDGAAALIVASGEAAEAHGLKPIARILGFASAGVAPRVMGVGPIPAVAKLCERLKLTPASFDVVELNEAFASQALACLRGLGLARTMPSTSIRTAGRSRSAIRSACRAPASPAPPRSSSSVAAAVMRWLRCASASARARRSRSNASDPPVGGRQSRPLHHPPDGPPPRFAREERRRRRGRDWRFRRRDPI